ncbi:MAG: hypothetical protein IJI68_01030 [Eggerthellaceae bacterium]|nr:hypothetical protein [Eggerthellaceae bacterium]
MTRKREGAAIRQEARANGYPARSRQPQRSLPEPRDAGEFESRGELVVTIVVGFLFLYAFMWLAAAY